MRRKLKSYLDEDFLKAKKVWSDFENKQNKYFKSPQSFKDKIWKNYIKGSALAYQKFTISQRDYKVKTITSKRGYQPQVLIKITGADKTLNQLKSHIKYISRNGILDIIVNDFFNDEEIEFKNYSIDEIAQTFNDDVYKLPTKNEIEAKNLKEKNENIHLVFSMKGENEIPINDIKEATINTIKQKFPNNHFILAMHNDTNNPHCHLDLKAVDSNGVRVKISPKDLEKMRDNFAKNLNELGHIAVNFKRKKQYFSKDRNPDTWQGHKSHHYKITGYGAARYNFSNDENDEINFYVKYETSKGKETILWGKELEDLMDKYQITNGDYVRFVVTDQQPVKKQIYDKKTKCFYEKTTYKNIWDCSVEGRAEKELKPIIKRSKAEFRVINKNNNDTTTEQKKPVKNIEIQKPKPKSGTSQNLINDHDTSKKTSEKDSIKKGVER